MTTKQNASMKEAQDLFIHGQTKAAFPLLLQLADQGEGRAMYILSQYFKYGYAGQAKDMARSLAYAEEGALAGDVLAALNALNERWDEEDPEERRDRVDTLLPELQNLAEAGDPLAERELADVLESDEPEEAAAWARKSAESGYFDAYAVLGFYYHVGYGVKKDLEKAAALYKKVYDGCDEKGDAAWNLAAAQTDPVQRFHWALKAAEQGEGKGYDLLGDAFRSGEGTGQDYDKAIACYKKALELGCFDGERDGEIYRYLGICYSYKTEYGQAADWMMKGARLEDEWAMYNLGQMYLQGDGVETDQTEGISWLKKAYKEGGEAAEDAAHAIAEGLNEAGRKREALLWLKELAAGDGEYAAESTAEAGWVYLDLEDYGKALECFHKAAAMDEESGLLGLGLLYARGAGVDCDVDKAVSYYKKVIHKHGELEGLACDWLGELYEDMGQEKKAVSMYRKAAELGNEDSVEKLEELEQESD